MAELRDDYTAKRSASDNVLATIGTWKLVNGNALVEWDDGWKDLLRRTDHGVEKLAFWNNEQEPRDISPAKKQT